MKAYSNYTMPVGTAAWVRRGAALLVFAALMLGLMLTVRANSQLTEPISSGSSSAYQSTGLIAACRACRDEWVAAQAAQRAVAVPARQPRAASVVSSSRAASPIGSCRACRDEWIAAQSPRMPTAGMTFDQPEELLRTSGPR
jgi:hypothetical protein